ncbi:LOW QUALITY PROTEIN: AT-rich interactive domain-containing protein 4A-like [Limulus polyphemus]|uniref:LOW QUALITY PROTEIN: AT-rich interactive domain-containing protein 4A-like n=1 Tax=Limulus polyphemus TaxID=6850 RepID=A0ABM1B8X3_LIMPO|nr:LOW QUALITY PROTEIN: AT-rich interactive domain-containing protein 4A-like [Limulus polyphemus]
MNADEPPYLTIGTDVSAKYRGAFCEAKVKKIMRQLKCKVTFKNSLGSAVLPEDQVRGVPKVGAKVEAKHPEKKSILDAIINKVLDQSLYTVVFDDGDETTLRRTSLCLKSGRHFAESETLDQLPLTNPEHFGNPVVGSKAKRKRRSTLNSSSIEDLSSDEESPPRKVQKPKLKDKDPDLGKVVRIDMGDRRKKDSWFPGLIVAPSAQDSLKINTKEEYLIRSFRDGKYYQSSKKDVKEFQQDINISKIENTSLKAAVEKAFQFIQNETLPPQWDWDVLGLNSTSAEEDDNELESESSDDEPSEEKDHFVAQLYKFMDDRGTPINIAPTVGNRDLNLYKLFKTVHKLGGFNKVSSQNMWKIVLSKMGLPPSVHATPNQMRSAYKRFLHSFEDFNRKLGCTMVTTSRSSRVRHRSERHRIFIHPKDREVSELKATGKETLGKSEKQKKREFKEEENQNEEIEKGRLSRSQTLAKDEDLSNDNEKQPVKEDRRPRTREEAKREKSASPNKQETLFSPKAEKREKDNVKKSDGKRDTLVSENDTKEERSSVKEEKQLKDVKNEKSVKLMKQDEKNLKQIKVEKLTKSKRDNKNLKEEKVEEKEDKFLKEKITKGKRKVTEKRNDLLQKVAKKQLEKPKVVEDDKPHQLEDENDNAQGKKLEGRLELGDRVKVKYGSGKQQKIYEAKITKIETDAGEKQYSVHYTGWNVRYDEWVKRRRIIEKITEKITTSKVKKANQLKGVQGANTPATRGRPPGLSVARLPSHSSPSTSSRRSSTSSSPSVSGRGRSTRSDRNSLSESPFVYGLTTKRQTRHRSGISVTSQNDVCQETDESDEEEYASEIEVEAQDDDQLEESVKKTDELEPVFIEDELSLSEVNESDHKCKVEQSEACSDYEINENIFQDSSEEDKKNISIKAEEELEIQEDCPQDKNESLKSLSNVKIKQKVLKRRSKLRKEKCEDVVTDIFENYINIEDSSSTGTPGTPSIKDVEEDCDKDLTKFKADEDWQDKSDSSDSTCNLKDKARQEEKYYALAVEENIVLKCDNFSTSNNCENDVIANVDEQQDVEESSNINEEQEYEDFSQEPDVANEDLPTLINTGKSSTGESNIMKLSQSQPFEIEEGRVEIRSSDKECMSNSSSDKEDFTPSNVDGECALQLKGDVKEEEVGEVMKSVSAITSDVVKSDTEVTTIKSEVNDSWEPIEEVFEKPISEQKNDMEKEYLTDSGTLVVAKSSSVEDVINICSNEVEKDKMVSDNFKELEAKKEGKKKKLKVSKLGRKDDGTDADEGKPKEGKGRSKKKKVELEDSEVVEGKGKMKKGKDKKKGKKVKSDGDIELGGGKQEYSHSESGRVKKKDVEDPEKLKKKENETMESEKAKRKEKKKKTSKVEVKEEDTMELDKTKKEKKKLKKNKDGVTQKKPKKKKKGKTDNDVMDTDDEKNDSAETSVDNEKIGRATKKEKKKKKAKMKDAPPPEEEQDTVYDEVLQKTEKSLFEESDIYIPNIKDNEVVDDNTETIEEAAFLLCEEKVPASPVAGDSMNPSYEHQPQSVVPSTEVPESSRSEDIHQQLICSLTSAAATVLSFSKSVARAPLSDPPNKHDSAVLDNTPPTTPGSVGSVSSNSPPYEQEGSSAESARYSRDSVEEESDSYQGDAKNIEVPLNEDSCSRTDSICSNASSGFVDKSKSLSSTSKKNKQPSCISEDASPAKKKKKNNRQSQDFIDVGRASTRSRHTSSKVLRGESRGSHGTGENRTASNPRLSDHSSSSPQITSGSTNSSLNAPRSPRFNFYVSLDDYTDADKRIAILQESLTELRKTYMALKAEVALIDRRRKRAKKKEREAAAANSVTSPGSCTQVGEAKSPS